MSQPSAPRRPTTPAVAFKGPQRSRRNRLAWACATLCASALPAHALDAVWNGGTGNWADAGGWSTLAVPNAALLNVRVDGGQLQLSRLTLGSNAAAGQLFIDAGDQLTVTGGGGLALHGGLAQNAGQLSLAGSANGYAWLNLNANTTLAGTGTTTLSTHSSGYNGRVLGNGHTLTIASGHTLRGTGNLGEADLNVVNQGTLAVDASDFSFAANLGNAGTFNNSAGLVQVADGGRFTLNSGTLSGGTVQGQGRGSLVGGGGNFSALALVGQLTLTGGTYSDVALNGSIHLGSGSSMAAGGVITNHGQWTLAGGAGGYSVLILNADTTLAGAGTTTLATHSSGYNGRVQGGGHTLTIASGHTLRGTGVLGEADLNVVNQGRLLADTGDFSFTANLGLAGTLNNNAGLVQVADGAHFQLASGTLRGGTVQGLGDSSLGGGGVYTDLTLAGTLQVRSGSSLQVAGTLNNTGSFVLAGGASGYSVLNLNAHTTLAGSGTTALATHSSGYNGRVTGNGHTLTIASGHTLRGTGALGEADLNVVNRGRLVVDASDFGFTANLGNAGTFNNSAGLVQVADGGQFYLSSGTLQGGTVQGMGGNSRVGGGHFVGVGLTGTLQITGGRFQDSRLNGTASLGSGRTMGLRGNFTNEGQLTLAGGASGYSVLSLDADSTLAGGGQTLFKVDNTGYQGLVQGNGNALTIASGHTVAGAGMLGQNDLRVLNLGVLRADDGTLQVLTTQFDNTQGRMEVSDDGQLYAVADIALGDASSLVFDISGSGSSSHGRWTQVGDLRLDGTLQLAFSGYSAQVGDSFTLVQFSGNLFGAFDQVLANGYALGVQYNANDVSVSVLAVSSVPEPTGALLMSLGLAGLAGWYRRAKPAAPAAPAQG